MLTHVLHTGLEVASLTEAVELYKSLGFEVTHQFEKSEPSCKVAIVQKGDTAFELFQFDDPSHPGVPFLRHHVGFYSDDLEQDVQRFVEQGYKLVIPINEGMVYRFAYVQDRSGLCYEISTKKETE